MDWNEKFRSFAKNKKLSENNDKSKSKDKKIELTEVKPGMSEEEIYKKLMKNLKKQGINIAENKKESKDK